ncbi:MAG: formylglycine-generating enzyme family protein, partial [Planctomycetota bacterium]
NGHADGLEDIAWYKANSEGETHPVGGLQPNSFGLFDMLGNVWEWCRDNTFREYSAEHVADPVNEEVSSAIRVMRGGSFAYSARNVRSAYRGGHPPGSRNDYLGFRCSSSQ